MKKYSTNILCLFLFVCICFTALGDVPASVREILSQSVNIASEKKAYSSSMTDIDLSPYSWSCNFAFDDNQNMWYNGNDAGDYNIHGLIISRANVLSGNKIPEKYMDVVNKFSQKCDVKWRNGGEAPCPAFHGAGNYIANIKYLWGFANAISKHRDGDSIEADAYYADAAARRSFKPEILNNNVFSRLSDTVKKIVINNCAVTEPGQTEGERCRYIVLGLTMHMLGDLYAHRLIVPIKALNPDGNRFDDTVMFDPSLFCTDEIAEANPGSKSWVQFKNDVKAGRVWFSAVRDYIRPDVKKGIYEDSPEFYPERFYEAIYSAACFLTHFDEDFNINILSPVGSLKLYNYNYFYNAVADEADAGLFSAIKPAAIQLNKTSCSSSSPKSFMLTASAAASYPLNRNVLWTSTDNDVAKVNSDGKVVLCGYGRCLILASLRSDPQVCATCIVNVTKSKNEFTCSVNKNGTVKIKKYNWDKSTIKIPEKINGKKVTSIESLNNFSNGFSEVKKIVIPKTVKLIGSPSVDELEHLEEIKVSGKNKNYSSDGGVLFNKSKTVLYAYPRCRKTAGYTVPYKVRSIYEKAFCRSKLRSVQLGKNVEKIGNSAFYSGRFLSEVTLPHNLAYIGREAFCSTSVKSIKIPQNVSYIGEYALGFWSAGGKTGHEIPGNNYLIIGKKYSSAYWYALYNKIDFKAV